jgi:hypothetical protein
MMRKNMKCKKWRLKLMALGCFLGVVVEATAQHPGHSTHPLMSGQRLYLQLQLPARDATSDGSPGVGAGNESSKRVEVPLKMVTTEAAQSLDQPIVLPAPRKPVVVRRYLPKAVMEQNVHPDESGQGLPAVELSLAGPSQSFRRWLAANDPERNRLVSYIGTWRFMAAKSRSERDALWHQFETEFSRAPELVVRRAGDLREQRVSADVGKSYSLEDGQGKITVKKFYPDCGMDRTTGEATNQSDRRRNPAVLVEIGNDKSKETRWVFAKFPGFAPAQGHELPYQVMLDCAVEPAESLPDFAIVAVGDETELWARSNGTTKSNLVTPEEKVVVPGSSYQFSVGKVIRSARMSESYRKDEKGKAALEVEYAGEDGGLGKLWIELGHTRSVKTADGPIMVTFLVRDESAGKVTRGAHP